MLDYYTRYSERIAHYRKESLMGKTALVMFVLAVVFSIILGIANYQINRDIEGWKTRAQVSSEPNDMHEYMGKVQAAMEELRMDRGYADLIFQTPENDMGLIYHTVKQHVDQADVLTKMNRASPEYQTGLDNLRGSIRELNLYAYEFWLVHDGLVWNVLCWVCWILFLLFGVLWMANN